MAPLLLVMLQKCSCDVIGEGGTAHVVVAADAFHLGAYDPCWPRAAPSSAEPLQLVLSSSRFSYATYYLHHALAHPLAQAAVHRRRGRTGSSLCSSCRADGPSLTRCLLQPRLLPWVPSSSSSFSIIITLLSARTCLWICGSDCCPIWWHPRFHRWRRCYGRSFSVLTMARWFNCAGVGFKVEGSAGIGVKAEGTHREVRSIGRW